LLLTSSGAVYGRQPPDLAHIPEDHPGGPDPTDPRSAYGEGKRLAELLCTLFTPGGPACKIARCFAFVGPLLPLDRNFAAGNFIRDALAGGPIRVAGDGTPYRSYLFAADLAAWLWTILVRGAPARPYNVGSDAALDIAAVAAAVAGQFRPPPAVAVATPPAPGLPAERYVPSVERARRELGLDVWVPLGEALRRTVRFAAAVRSAPAP
jgi:dTDP-glucose 4,6-dehydratase